MKIATAHNIPFVAIGAGHGSASTMDAVHNGIQIDLGHFRYAKLDAENNLVTIGGATKFEQVWDALYPAGKELRMSFFLSFFRPWILLEIVGLD